MENTIMLSRREAQLVMLVTRNLSLPGLPELDLNIQTPLGEKERDSLTEKGALHRQSNGRLALDQRLGSMIQAIHSSTSFLQGGIRYTDNMAVRHNLYLTGDSFILVVREEEDLWRFTWLPDIRLAIGSILFALEQPLHGCLYPEKYFGQSDVLENKISSNGAIATFQFHTSQGNEEFQFAVQDRKYYQLHESKLKPGSASQTLFSLSEVLLSAHIQNFGGGHIG